MTLAAKQTETKTGMASKQLLTRIVTFVVAVKIRIGSDLRTDSDCRTGSDYRTDSDCRMIRIVPILIALIPVVLPVTPVVGFDSVPAFDSAAFGSCSVAVDQN